MRKIILFTLVLLSVWGSVANEVKPESPLFNYTENDQSLIELLIKKGSNANKEHWVNFIVDCKTEKQVTEIISKAKLVGFDGDYIAYSEKRKVWSSSLGASMKLNLNEISAYRAMLMPLIPTKSCGGVGWGAAVVK